MTVEDRKLKGPVLGVQDRCRRQSRKVRLSPFRFCSGGHIYSPQNPGTEKQSLGEGQQVSVKLWPGAASPVLLSFPHPRSRGSGE